MTNRVIEGNILELTPDARNANKGTKRGRDLHQKSVSELGMGRSVLADKNGKLIAGNKTVEVAADLGIENTVVVQTWGDEVVVVQRMDLDLDDDHGKARKLAYADNLVGMHNLDFAHDVIAMDLEQGVEAVTDFWFPEELEKMGHTLPRTEPEDEDDELAEDAPPVDQPKEEVSYPFDSGDIITMGAHELLVGETGHDEVLHLMRQWQGYTGFKATVGKPGY